MLILSRKSGEAVLIGEGPGQIVVRVVRSTKAGTVLSFEAPRSVRILREELSRGNAAEEQREAHAAPAA